MKRPRTIPRVGSVLVLAAFAVAVGIAEPGNCQDRPLPGPPAKALSTDSSWIPTGSLNTARAGHTATLLTSGKVLVVGGNSGRFNSNTLDSAELYDPVNGTWSVTGSLKQSRSYHTATLLPNGLVLVAGGKVVSGQSFVLTRTAELYDPAAGEWRSTGDLNTGRNLHTATLLQNGNVLVAGGAGGNAESLDSAELYDPATGMWSRTGNLVAARYWHTATLLQNGKVLVAGGEKFDVGSNLGQLLKSAELYDPVSGTWNRTADLNVFHIEHTATQLQNGKVLVASGDDAYDYDTTSNGIAEIYDPGTATWSYTGNLGAIRDGHTATLLPSGKVLVTGGVYYSTMKGAELYDPVSGTWIPAANIIPRFYGHTATLLSDGKVLVAGGASEDDNPTALASAELYEAAAPPPGTIDSGFTGAWYDPAQSGHGLFVEVLPGNRVFVGWMTFNPAGTEQAWFVGVGTYSGNTATIPAVSLPTGGRWIPNFNPNQIINNLWGTLTFTFTDGDHGKVDFNSVFGYGTGSMNLTRLTRPAGVTTAGTVRDAVAPGDHRSGLHRHLVRPGAKRTRRVCRSITRQPNVRGLVHLQPDRHGAGLVRRRRHLWRRYRDYHAGDLAHWRTLDSELRSQPDRE